MLGSHALRSRALITLVIVTLFVSLCMPGLAFGAREGETSIKPIDDSGNGKPDRYEVDWDGDGTVDEEWTDPDEDGVIDTATVQNTGGDETRSPRGKPGVTRVKPVPLSGGGDMTAIDWDGDGLYDEVWWDFDGDGTVDDTDVYDVESKVVDNTGSTRFRGVFVGVRNGLDYPDNDVDDLTGALEKHGASWDSGDMTKLKDGAATPAAIENAINAAKADSKPGDEFIFYFSGHGGGYDKDDGFGGGGVLDTDGDETAIPIPESDAGEFDGSGLATPPAGYYRVRYLDLDGDGTTDTKIRKDENGNVDVTRNVPNPPGTWKVVGSDSDGDGDVDGDDGGVDMNGDGDKDDTFGVDDTIQVAGNVSVTDDQLTTWLSGFPESVTIVVILDSCYSGSFVPDLKRVKDKAGKPLRPGHLEAVAAAPADDVAWEMPISNGVLTQGILDALDIVPGDWWDPWGHHTSAADWAGNEDDITTTRELFAWAGPSAVTYIASDVDGDGLWGEDSAEHTLDWFSITSLEDTLQAPAGSVPTTGVVHINEDDDGDMKFDEDPWFVCESFFDIYYDPEFGKLGTPRSVTNFSGEIPLSMNEMMPEMGLWSEVGIATGTPAPSLELTVREVPGPFEPLYPGPQMSSMFGPAAYASAVYEIECDVVEVYPELDQMDLAQEPTPSVEPTRIAEPFLGTPTDLVAGIRPVEAAPPGLSVPHVWNEGTSMWDPVPMPLGYNGDRGVEEWLVTGFSKYALLAPGPAPLRVPDTTPPDAPSRLSGTMSGNTLWLSWTNPTDPDFDNTRVWMSTTRFATDANDTSGMTPMDSGKRPYASATPPDGLFYFSVFSQDAAGNWSAGDYTSVRVGDVKTTRLADHDRFTTAVEIAREGFDPDGTKSWGTVTDVVIASGDDRAAADPLAAAGLCWLYDAPLFLVSADRTPSAVKAAIKEIAAANGPVTVHIVGGPVSVPEARYNDIKSYVGGANVSKDRLVSTGGRYDLAQAIAARMNTQASAQGKPAPSVALVANGADSTKFFDALALSTVAANEGAPILLVAQDSVPWQTRATLGAMSPSAIYVGGGPKTVSASVYNQLAADDRWSGNDRYLTAVDIANEAQKLGLINHEYVGVAAVLPDALTGGSMVGQKGGVLLITNGQSLTSSTGSWLSAHKSAIKDSYVFGGPVSVSEKVRTQIDQRLQ